jgi:hypothetical protein
MLCRLYVDSSRPVGAKSDRSPTVGRRPNHLTERTLPFVHKSKKRRAATSLCNPLSVISVAVQLGGNVRRPAGAKLSRKACFFAALAES